MDSTKSWEEQLEKALLETLTQDDEEEAEESSLHLPLPIFPLNKRPLFPGIAAPVSVDSGPFCDLLRKMQKEKANRIILLLTHQEGADTVKTSPDELYHVGVVAKVVRILPQERGGVQAILKVENRVQASAFERGKMGVWHAMATPLEPTIAPDDEVEAYIMGILSAIKDILKLNPIFKEELQVFLNQSDFTEPARLADYTVTLTSAKRDELQGVLESIELKERLEKSLRILMRELDLAKLQHNLTQKVEATIAKTQKEYYLREQLKTIRSELGIDRDERSLEMEKFEKRLKKRDPSEEVMAIIRDEMQRLATLEPQSGEYGICRNHLDWLTVVPWGIYSKQNATLKSAEKVLHADHYGIEEVKERILELVALSRTLPALKGQILCLVGPPGVGKTSVGRSIARALKRKFYRFSVGGMHDEAEIKGHRRTYVGSMPGKLIQALKYTETMNPVIMLDEVDKMVQSFRGDPAAALLEVLDPEQNQEFLDHYLDVRCDLSQVLFILTANVVDQIPYALRDRLEIIQLSGYATHEKIEIVKRHLLPKLLKETGLKKNDALMSDQLLQKVIDDYARESGVRNLERQLKKILRKRAIEILRESEEKGTGKIGERRSRREIKADELTALLGEPKFHSDQIYEETPVGVATGLAWTAMGGATLYIEAVKTPAEKSELKLTGQAGSVMKESSEIAWTFLKSFTSEHYPSIPFFEGSSVHMHIPEGATPKDGPSAGVTMATALLSLLLEQPVDSKLAMTGEVTLTGKVLPIGGVKEKVLAARRSGIEELVFPAANRRDCEKLAADLREKITFHYVEHFEEIIPHAFKER